MSHFAKVENGRVITVIVAEQAVVDAREGTWVQTSYNTKDGIHYGPDNEPAGGVALRHNYAGIGFVYDSVNDVFYPPQPFPSWTQNASTYVWEAPIALPDNVQVYRWDESAYQADNTTGWVRFE